MTDSGLEISEETPVNEVPDPGHGRTEDQNENAARRWIVRAVAAIVVPILLLVLLETGLRFFDVGYSTDLLQPCTIHGQAASCYNLFFPAPFFPPGMDEFEHSLRDHALKAAALQSSYAMAENVFAVTQSDLSQTGGPARLWVDRGRFRSEHVAVPVREQAPGAVCFVSSGRLLPRHKLRIVSEQAAELGDGHVGEILVKSDCLFDGYFNRPDLTRDVLADGWYCTGDLGFQWDGELFVVGRKKDLLIVGGENLYPQDIEEIVAGHPEIHDGRVVAGGFYNAESGTEDIVVVAEVEAEEALMRSPEIEQEVRRRVVAGLGVSVRSIFLKAPKWIVKSTAGKAARSATLEKLVREHPELGQGA